MEFLAHSHFREANGFVKAIRETLPEDHKIRRLLTPFTLGTVRCNRVFNEFLRENGLYHRAFGFKYTELQRLIRESMSDAPILQSGQVRDAKDRMKYRFRLFRKKVQVMKKLPDEIYPVFADLWAFWIQALDLVEHYQELYYNKDEKDDSLLESDTAVQFLCRVIKKFKNK